MNYDFDMVSIFPDEIQEEFRSQFNDLGLSAMASEQKAMFRDPRAVEALLSADEVVRGYFVASGFGVFSSGQQVPPGYYLARDEEARTDIILALAANVRAHNLKDADWGLFDIRDFYQQLQRVQSIDEVDVPAKMAAHKSANKKQSGAFGYFCAVLVLLLAAYIKWFGGEDMLFAL